MHAGLNQRRRSQNPEGRNPERTLTVRDFVPRDFVIRDFDMHRTRGRLSIDDSLTSSWRSSLSGGGQNPESRKPDRRVAFSESTLSPSSSVRHCAVFHELLHVCHGTGDWNELPRRAADEPFLEVPSKSIEVRIVAYRSASFFTL
ncbi:hypothetical protein M513_04840 [Trichuris suis]|uniref:Uncharacterized protein n=1 Tax=Trichuris suis TaxID=68888 RepID=A0A085MAQ2_9BILA|nr:hypothetical protein M513_04840 [Trichuris suis]